MMGTVIDSETRPTVVQIKRKAYLSTMISLKTKHAICGISFIFCYFLSCIVLKLDFPTSIKDTLCFCILHTLVSTVAMNEFCDITYNGL